MAKWLEYRQTPTEIFLDLTQFQGIEAKGEMFCRNCQCKRSSHSPLACNSRRTDGEILVPPQWMTVRAFCSVCGWMYRKVPITKRMRNQVERMDKGQCVYCGIKKKPRFDFGLDHLTAEIDGGQNTVQNLVLACQSCNSSKGRREGRYKPRYGRFSECDSKN